MGGEIEEDGSYVGQQMQRRRRWWWGVEGGVSVLRRRKVTGKAGVRHAVADYKTRSGSNCGPAPFALAPLPLIG